MSYVKLCQIVSQGNPDENGKPQTVYYQEDCEGNVIVNNPVYPLTLQCEIINWLSKAEYDVRGQIVSRTNVSVTIPSAPPYVRLAVVNLLVASHPTLVI